jgi:hypothetical protein
MPLRGASRFLGAPLGLAATLAGCAPAPPPEPTRLRVSRIEEHRGPPDLGPTIGFADPGHPPRKIEPPPVEVLSEAPAPAAPFAGTLELGTPATVTFTPGDARAVSFGLVVRSPNALPASIRRIRVTGFERVVVGLERRFWRVSEADALTQFGGFLLGLVLNSVVALQHEPRSAPPREEPFSLEVSRGYKGYGVLRIAVPEDTPKGRYAGRIEIEGNFAPQSFPFEVVVVRFDEKADALLAGIDAPESATPIGRMLAKVPAPASKKGRPVDPSRAQKTLEVDTGMQSDAHPQVEGAWKRWLVAGSGVWDLGALEWLGPITDKPPLAFTLPRAVAGPREAPRLFVRQERSVDVISIRERRTIDRIATPSHAQLDEPFHVSPEGDRVLVRCDSALCLFSREGDHWTSVPLYLPCTFPWTCKWVETDPELHEVIVASGPEEPRDAWTTLVRYELPSLERASLALERPCREPSPALHHLYSARYGLLVSAVVNSAGADRADELSIVRLPDLSATRFAVPSPGASRMAFDERSGDVFFLRQTGATNTCAQLTPGSLVPRSCAALPPEAPRTVEGTPITYATSGYAVSYRR